MQVTGTWRSHQVPLAGVRDNPAHLALLDAWLRSYRPGELFDAAGAPVANRARRQPGGGAADERQPVHERRAATRDLDLPDFRKYAVDIPAPAVLRAESTRRLRELLRDLYAANPDWFRLFCPDETSMFASYEAFAMISAAQTVQHSKWLEEAGRLPWRAKVPSLNVLITSTAWRNDHNGFSHAAYVVEHLEDMPEVREWSLGDWAQPG